MFFEQDQEVQDKITFTAVRTIILNRKYYGQTVDDSKSAEKTKIYDPDNPEMQAVRSKACLYKKIRNVPDLLP